MKEGSPEAEGRILGQTHGLQWWSMLVLALGLIGLALAVYGLLRNPGPGATDSAAALLPPLLFGLIAVLVLLNFYLAQRDAVMRGVQQELVHQKIEAELNRELALLDPVTEVYNRRYARVILKREVSRVKRYGQGLSVMMVDITGFRRVNDSLGHTGGDVVLRQIAHLLQTRIRNSDIIVRFGGDEFLLVLSEAEAGGVELLAGRLKSSFTDWSAQSGMADFGLRLAVGVAHFTPESAVDEILALAEQRMIQDKRPSEPAERDPRAVRPAAAKLTN